MVKNAYIRLCDKNQNLKEICRCNLALDQSTATIVHFADFVKEADGTWNFKNISEGFMGDLNAALARSQA